jgi:hypothetical protein
MQLLLALIEVGQFLLNGCAQLLQILRGIVGERRAQGRDNERTARETMPARPLAGMRGGEPDGWLLIQGSPCELRFGSRQRSARG